MSAATRPPASELDVQGKEVVVKRVSSALDCGLTVNPDGARSQVEGSIVMGLGTALYEGADFEGGRLLNGSFARYRVPRSNTVPRISVALVGDAETPSTGAGEPAIVPVAAAVSNAVFRGHGPATPRVADPALPLRGCASADPEVRFEARDGAVDAAHELVDLFAVDHERRRQRGLWGRSGWRKCRSPTASRASFRYSWRAGEVAPRDASVDGAGSMAPALEVVD